MEPKCYGARHFRFRIPGERKLAMTKHWMKAGNRAGDVGSHASHARKRDRSDAAGCEVRPANAAQYFFTARITRPDGDEGRGGHLMESLSRRHLGVA